MTHSLAAAPLPSAELRIDDLARKAKASTRNVRAYITRGLLPPPQMRGRVAYYGDEHLVRLKLIARLLDRGFSLTSIREVVEAWEKGHGLQALLGLEAVTTPWAGEPRTVTLLELARLAPRLAAHPELLERTIELEVLARDGTGFRILNQRLLQAGNELSAAGVSGPAILDALGPLRASMSEVARLFVALFVREFWDGEAGTDAKVKGLPEIAARVQRLRPLASAAVDALLEQMLDRAIAAEAAHELAKATRPHARTPSRSRTR